MRNGCWRPSHTHYWPTYMLGAHISYGNAMLTRPTSSSRALSFRIISTHYDSTYMVVKCRASVCVSVHINADISCKSGLALRWQRLQRDMGWKCIIVGTPTSLMVFFCVCVCVQTLFSIRNNGTHTHARTHKYSTHVWYILFA